MQKNLLSNEVYYVVKNKETKLKNNLIVDYDKSVCSITDFEIDGQLGQSTIYESEDSHTITVYMPYDHEYQDYYTPSNLHISAEEFQMTKVNRYNILLI